MDVFAALGDPVRRDLVRRLARGPARVVDLAREHSISRPAISRHLRVLGEAGLTEVEDVGRERHYRLRPAGLADVQALLAQIAPGRRATAFSDADLDGLDLEVRRTGRERTERDRTANGRGHDIGSDDLKTSTDQTEEAG